MTKGKILKILLIILGVIMISAVGYGIWKINKESEKITKGTPESIISKKGETEEIDTSDWKIYQNEKYGFEFKYPPDWKVGKFEIRPLDYIRCVNCQEGLTPANHNKYCIEEIPKEINLSGLYPPELPENAEVVQANVLHKAEVSYRFTDAIEYLEPVAFIFWRTSKIEEFENLIKDFENLGEILICEKEMKILNETYKARQCKIRGHAGMGRGGYSGDITFIQNPNSPSGLEFRLNVAEPFTYTNGGLDSGENEDVDGPLWKFYYPIYLQILSTFRFL
jgi:hypothetical protein